MRISRRKTLALIPAAAALVTAPALAAMPAGGDARLVQLERRLERVVAWVNATPMSDAELDHAGDIESAIDDEILATPATGFDGLMVKWRRTVDHLEGYGIYADEWHDDFEANLIRVAGRRS